MAIVELTKPELEDLEALLIRHIAHLEADLIMQEHFTRNCNKEQLTALAKSSAGQELMMKHIIKKWRDLKEIISGASYQEEIPF